MNIFPFTIIQVQFLIWKTEQEMFLNNFKPILKVKSAFFFFFAHSNRDYDLTMIDSKSQFLDHSKVATYSVYPINIQT